MRVGLLLVCLGPTVSFIAVMFMPAIHFAPRSWYSPQEFKAMLHNAFHWYYSFACLGGALFSTGVVLRLSFSRDGLYKGFIPIFVVLMAVFLYFSVSNLDNSAYQKLKDRIHIRSVLGWATGRLGGFVQNNPNVELGSVRAEGFLDSTFFEAGLRPRVVYTAPNQLMLEHQMGGSGSFYSILYVKDGSKGRRCTWDGVVYEAGEPDSPP